MPVSRETTGPATRFSQFQHERITPMARCQVGAFTPTTGIEGCGLMAASSSFR